MPRSMDYSSVLEHIKSFPDVTEPEVFGLHNNADITKDYKEANALLHGTLLTQTSISLGGGGEGGLVVELTGELLARLPPPFDVGDVEQRYPALYLNSMNTVLRQELIRYNRLTSVVRKTLHGVHLATQGLAVMSAQLEQCHDCFVRGAVPPAWMDQSYPTMKGLGSYFADLLARPLSMNFHREREVEFIE
ncbi:unnamed protein product [Plutella xylostella]|uniref:(diamondback moth) hypothetical protein n=1 Tax=Plutella xylostella TaxID=51655 RepID=A0A8S4D9S0_PLUXY|nr:unnamed protein product [Plutella xylostella]